MKLLLPLFPAEDEGTSGRTLLSPFLLLVLDLTVLFSLASLLLLLLLLLFMLLLLRPIKRWMTELMISWRDRNSLPLDKVRFAILSARTYSDPCCSTKLFNNLILGWKGYGLPTGKSSCSNPNLNSSLLELSSSYLLLLISPPDLVTINSEDDTAVWPGEITAILFPTLSCPRVAGDDTSLRKACVTFFIAFESPKS